MSYRTRRLSIGLSFKLHPYFVYTSSEGSGESVHLHRLAWACVARQCYEYKYVMLRLKLSMINWKASFSQSQLRSIRVFLSHCYVYDFVQYIEVQVLSLYERYIQTTCKSVEFEAKMLKVAYVSMSVCLGTVKLFTVNVTSMCFRICYTIISSCLI